MSDASTTAVILKGGARTPIGRAFRGAFNDTHGAVLAGHAVQHAVARAGIDPAEIEDVTMGCGLPEGATGNNIARLAAIRAGLPESSSAVTVNRYCASGLQAIAQAAQRVIVDGVPAADEDILRFISVRDFWLAQDLPLSAAILPDIVAIATPEPE